MLFTGLASGVFLRSLFVFPWAFLVFAILIGILFLLPFFLTRTSLYLYIAIFCIFFGAGALRTTLADAPPPASFLADLGKAVSYTGIVREDPDVRDTHQRIVVQVEEGPDHTRILALTDRYPEVEVGERVEIEGRLTLPESFSTSQDAGRIFRYDKFLQKDGIYFVLERAQITHLAPPPSFSIAHIFASIKHTFLDGIGTVLPEPYASLAGGIVIGGKSGLGPDLKEMFIVTGLVQIIVLSGYNVMIVAEWILYLIGRTKLRREYAGIAAALAVFLFVAIAGASSTAIRAACMAIIALYARATGKTYAAGRALIVVATGMILWNPLLLLFDPGFGLSITATAGLIWLAPLIELRLATIANTFWRNGIATTIAAQLAVLPLLLYQTGVLSVVALPANLLVLAVMPLAMGFSALAGLSGSLFGAYAWPIALPAYLINAYIIAVAKYGSALPFAALSVPSFPFIFTLAAYAVLIYRAFARRASTTPQFTFSKNAST